jgi:hypothetical protein
MCDVNEKAKPLTSSPHERPLAETFSLDAALPDERLLPKMREKKSGEALEFRRFSLASNFFFDPSLGNAFINDVV